MHFASDNWAGASEPVTAALARHSGGHAPAYGGDDLTRSIEERLQELFETDCSVFMVATGTGANALALSAMTGPAGTVFCHMDAHIRVDECGAPEFLTSGARMWGLEGRQGKLTPDAILQGLEQVPTGVVHHGQPNAVSLSQATEIGTIYSIAEIEALSQTAQDNHLAMHMDGARFANALVGLGATPAEMSWKAGIDILSFGATKNGAWCAEAVIIFNKELGKDFAYRRKRAGHLFSKMRFVSAQFEGYLDKDHWQDNARHANAMASTLATGLEALPEAYLAWPAEANEVFVYLQKTLAQSLMDKGALFHPWPTATLHPDDRLEAKHLDLDEKNMGLYRLVCSYRTTQDEIDQFLTLAAEA